MFISFNFVSAVYLHMLSVYLEFDLAGVDC